MRPSSNSLYPGDATPRWRYCAPRVEGGERLDAVKRAIDRRAGIELPEPGTPPGRLEGRLDGVEGGRISGWAFHPDRPEAPVWLEVLDGDGVIARVHARRYRTDLEAAGVGDGRHGFELHLTGQMRTRKKIRVRRVEDGTELQGSPLVIEARGGEALLEDARRVIAAAIIDPSDTAALDALADELLHGVDALRQARAKRRACGGRPPVMAGAKRRFRAESPAERAHLALTEPPPPRPSNGRLRRALIIDAQLPRPEHDAGSQAILSHAAALAGLGFQVEFVAAHQLARADQASAALEQAGYVVHRVPLVASVEEVLRRHRNTFDVVYLHRLANAEAYAALARTWQARARLLYCVADLHHVRLARQAAVQASAELADEARAVRVRELNAMRLCDAVVTHSTAEADVSGAGGAGGIGARGAVDADGTASAGAAGGAAWRGGDRVVVARAERRCGALAGIRHHAAGLGRCPAGRTAGGGQRLASPRGVDHRSASAAGGRGDLDRDAAGDAARNSCAAAVRGGAEGQGAGQLRLRGALRDDADRRRGLRAGRRAAGPGGGGRRDLGLADRAAA